MDLRPLTDTIFDTIHQAFLEAFSDYLVKLAPTAAQLTEMLTRRGWAPELSAGVFEHDRLVAFTLNGFDGESGYDSGTGVIPSHRHRGLARQMMAWSCDRLREAGARRYVLEVLEANAPAVALYRDCSFAETRRLQSWTFTSEEAVVADNTEMMPEWCDIEPSWQNSAASIGRARDRRLILGDRRGYLVVFPASGDVAQLAVDPAHRRQGLGTWLLQAAHTASGKPLRLMNLDTRAEGATAFLRNIGAKQLVTQLEMILPIAGVQTSRLRLSGVPARQ